MKRLSAEIPGASSPVTTRWRQSQARDLAAHFFEEEHSTTDPEASGSMLKVTPEKGTLILGEITEMLQAVSETLIKIHFLMGSLSCTTI